MDDIKPCNCRNKKDCPLNGQCQVEDIVYKCVVSTSTKPDKVYLGTAEGDFKKRYNNHTKSFKHERYANETTLSKFVWEMKEIHNENPTLVWSIVKRVPSYLNVSKKCLLCRYEKLEIVNFERQDLLLNKRSELISKCRHANKCLLRNYKSKD